MPLREDDVLLVWRLDRTGRSLKHLIELMGRLAGATHSWSDETKAVLSLAGHGSSP